MERRISDWSANANNLTGRPSPAHVPSLERPSDFANKYDFVFVEAKAGAQRTANLSI